MANDESSGPNFSVEGMTLQQCVEHLEWWHTTILSPNHAVKHAGIRRIAAAANRYGGYIVTGVRHHCPMMRMQMSAIGYEKLWSFAGGRDQEEQGFVDQWGIFLTREEAWEVAVAANQIIHPDTGGPKGTLFSEHYL